MYVYVYVCMYMCVCMCVCRNETSAELFNLHQFINNLGGANTAILPGGGFSVSVLFACPMYVYVCMCVCVCVRVCILSLYVSYLDVSFSLQTSIRQEIILTSAIEPFWELAQSQPSNNYTVWRYTGKGMYVVCMYVYVYVICAGI